MIALFIFSPTILPAMSFIADQMGCHSSEIHAFLNVAKPLEKQHDAVALLCDFMQQGQLSPKQRDFRAGFRKCQRQLVLCIQAAVSSVT